MDDLPPGLQRLFVLVDDKGMRGCIGAILLEPERGVLEGDDYPSEQLVAMLSFARLGAPLELVHPDGRRFWVQRVLDHERVEWLGCHEIEEAMTWLDVARARLIVGGWQESSFDPENDPD